MDKVNILGVNVHKVSYRSAVSKCMELIERGRQSYVVTPNAEIILKSLKDKDYLRVLNKASLSVPDSVSLLWAADYIYNNRSMLFGLLRLCLIPFKRMWSPLPFKVTGTDLFQDLCEELVKTDKKVYLMGASNGVADKTARKLEEKYPGLNVSGCSSELDVDLINKSCAEVLFVALGAPKQEKWISDNLRKLSSVKLAMGIGGAFDYVSGNVVRAPLFMQRIGLEWLYRLFRQPKRIIRIINAVVVFPIKVLRVRN